MTFKDNIQHIGQKATISHGGLVINVKILDYKFSYGRDRWQVTPMAGKGDVWVEKINLTNRE